MTELLTVTALPRSADPADAFHVSLFLGPRLAPSGTLTDFPVIGAWGQHLADGTITFELIDHTGVPFTITPLAAAESAVWAAIFPADTPVDAWTTTAPDRSRFRSFDARYVDSVAKLVHLAAMASNATAPPAPSESALTRLVDAYAHQWGLREHPGGMDYDERRITARLDALDREPGSAGRATGAEQLFLAIHQVRRFYEPRSTEAEQLAAYRARPDEGNVAKRPELEIPDFHQRVGRLGSQPAVMRALGLVIDLRVAETGRLADAQWLQARVMVDGNDSITLPTRVRCQATAGAGGPGLVTVPRDDNQWSSGALRLGDTNRFTVLDLDADASGLKLDRFLWTLPRLSQLERDGEPAHAAPPTLRAHGFQVVHTGRAAHLGDQLDATGAADPQLVARQAPLLSTEDVTRAVRVQVWDDTAQRWASLHARTTRVAVAGLDPFEVVDEGFVSGGVRTQADGTTPDIHVHEGLFGWSGWSLSAPHPALAIEHQYGGGGPATGAERHEELTDPVDPPDPLLHVVTSHRVVPGSLPRLRYGRRYAFRAFAVDLAGNSTKAADLPQTPPPVAPHAAAPPPAAAPGGLPAGVQLASERLAAAAATPAPALDLVRALRAEHRALITATVTGTVTGTGTGEGSRTAFAGPPGATLLGDTHDALRRTAPELVDLVAARVDTALRHRAPSSIDRRQMVGRTLSSLLDGDGAAMAAVAGWSPAALAAVARHLGELDMAPLLDLALATVTPLRPLLRWKPIDPPVVVPRRRYTEGESVRHLVIRSGVSTVRDPDQGDTITVVDPVAYGAEVEAAHPGLGYGPTSERHLAAPKVDQTEAEVHGSFDHAIGSPDPVERRRGRLIAERESGTFFSTSIPSLTDGDPPVTLAYVSLVDPPVDDPTTLATLADAQRGDPLTPGQYVVHDTDQAALPYLADPMAAGLSMVFPDAGLDRPLPRLIGTEGVTFRYDGDWPDPSPFRLVLAAGDALGSSSDARTINLALAPSDVQRFRLSSCLDPADLERLGLWRLLPDVVRQDPLLAEVAADGWLWALTPSEDVVVVHAVPKPLEAPRPILLTGHRQVGATNVAFEGAVDVHGPSTEHLDCEARWSDPVDDITQPGPTTADQRAVAYELAIGPAEDLALLWGGDHEVVLPVPGFGPVRVHPARHELGDTKHHDITYRFRAATRFREYFHPSLFATADDSSVVGPIRRVSVPSTVRPAKPVIRQILPLFRWSEATEPEQPFAVRRRRRAGLRIYLDRPWWSSGDGELLAVLLAPGANETGLDGYVSQWANDPIWRERHVARRPVFLELDQVLHGVGLDDRDQPARPVGPAINLPLADHPTRAVVTVLGYRPQYHPGRKLWFVDMALDPGSAAWPFVRLSVARYQPDSLPGQHLSPVVRCDFAQLPPERTATLSRPDSRSARVVVTGPVTSRPVEAHATTLLEAARAQVDGSRRLVARLERRNPAVTGDLGWTTISSVRLLLEGLDVETSTASFVGVVALPEPLDPARPPSGIGDLRITVEEVEVLPSDPDPASHLVFGRPTQLRLVYADHLPL